MVRDLDKKEQESYARFGMESQLIYNGKEANLFNLAEHPEWKDLTKELQGIYLSTMQDFNY